MGWGEEEVLAAVGALEWLWLLQGCGVYVGVEVASVSIGVVVAATVSTIIAPLVVGWAWVEDTVVTPWEVGVSLVSIGVDDVSFWCLVAKDLVVEGRAPSKS